MVNFSFNKEIGHDKYLKFMKENEILMKGFNPEK